MRIHFKILLTLFLSLPLIVAAEEPVVLTAKSPEHRTALLELYTSEGCSSCPPADRWLSSIKDTEFSGRELIPLAFHVTYWDYIGWRDRFAKEAYDLRQRELARYKNKRTIYTPQFVLNGDDYRTYNKFARDLRTIVSQAATVDLIIKAELNGDEAADIKVSSDIAKSELNDVAIYMAVFEQNLSSQVRDGENEGELLKHDYVVHQLYGPFVQSRPEIKTKIRRLVSYKPEWKQMDLGVAVFAQNPRNGEILQAVSLKLHGQPN